MATDLDNWKTKPTIEVLQDAQIIVDKYKDQIQEADYIALCNANRIRYDREKRRHGTPRSLVSNGSQGYELMVEDYEYRIYYLTEKAREVSRTLRHLPRAVRKTTTALFKKRAVRAFADEMELDDTVRTYDDLKSMFPEIKDEGDFYETARQIINKRLFLIRQDLKNEVRALRSAIRHLETRLRTNFTQGTSFLS